MKNRFDFIKKIYSEYIILIIKNNKYYVFSYDKKICDYFDININNIDKFNINYLILDNLNIIYIKEFKDNKYNLYLLRYFIISLINRY